MLGEMIVMAGIGSSVGGKLNKAIHFFRTSGTTIINAQLQMALLHEARLTLLSI